MTSRAGEAPDGIRTLAEERAAARAARDWPTADRLRDELEAAGWKVIDAGTSFRLEPVHPADVEVGGVVRYGRSDAVPSRLGEPASGKVSVIVVAREDPAGALRAVRGVLGHAPAGLDVVVVADGLTDRRAQPLSDGLAPDEPVEIVRTSVPLGQGAALNIGLRRCRGAIVVALDGSIEPTGDIGAPLVAALEDPAVAVAGPFGLRSEDLRHFEEVTAGPAAAIEGYLLAFRRADLVARGPVDEAFRFYRNLDIWLSLVLRDEGPGRAPRAARVVADVPVRRHEHAAWAATPPAERDRLSKRNFYRVLDRFRDRLDLAVG